MNKTRIHGAVIDRYREGNMLRHLSSKGKWPDRQGMSEGTGRRRHAEQKVECRVRIRTGEERSRDSTWRHKTSTDRKERVEEVRVRSSELRIEASGR